MVRIHPPVAIIMAVSRVAVELRVSRRFESFRGDSTRDGRPVVGSHAAPALLVTM